MQNLYSQEAPGCDFNKLQSMVAEGDIRAYEVLACCYLDKFDASDEDINRAIELLKIGAKKGDDNAMLTLWSVYYERGDKKNADKWISKMYALHQKNHEKHPSLQTEYNLAFDLQHGFGVEQDVTTARKMFESLANRGFDQAFFSLGMMYENGWFGCRKNRPKAYRYYQKGVELDEPNCMQVMAQRYNDKGSWYDPEKAYELYDKLSKYKFGWGIAQHEMGMNYIMGITVEEDWAIAKKYLAAASSLGDKDATIALNAVMAAERDCIKICGSLEAIPKMNLHARFAGALMAIKETGKLIPLD